MRLYNAIRDDVMFSTEIMSTFLYKAIKSHFKQSYDQQNLKLVVIPYEIYKQYNIYNNRMIAI